jgi:hypothetical protein
MRRLLAAAALTAAALVAAGCTGGTPSTQPSPAVSSSSAAPSTDPSAAVICADLKNKILDTDVRAFGAELGKMIAARAQGDKTAQAAAQQAAVDKLKEISGKLRADAAMASDPKLKDALTTSADNVDKLAADPSTFANITSIDQVGQLTQRFAQSLDEINKYCA